MAVPDYQTLMLPVLRFGASGEVSVRECIERLAEEFRLTDQERDELLPSGRQTTFANRIHWARTYLSKAGLLENTKRGHFKITPRGKGILDQKIIKITNEFLTQFEEFNQFRAKRNKDNEASSEKAMASEATPEEQLETALEEIENRLRADLLDRVVATAPTFFERIVVDLMLAMGYGGSRPAAGRRLGRTGDGGIDGIINEDTLGLDVIYLQAKRYSLGSAIGVEKVREFAGSLIERGATKGVFVTTSHFAKGAIEFAERIPQRLILIDGERLTALMIRHGVGVRTVRQIEFRRTDTDYFEDEESA